MSAVAASTTPWYQCGVASKCGWCATTEPSRADTAITMVSQFSQAKLTDATSHSCVTIMNAAATDATGCGVNNNAGAPSCATWFAATSTRCSGSGRRWKNQLNGPGIGCVSWW